MLFQNLLKVTSVVKVFPPHKIVYIARSFATIKFNGMEVEEDIDYSKWNKKQLLNRIRELENKPPQEIVIEPIIKTEPRLKPKKKKVFDFSKHNTRFIALRFAYLGWNYNGLALQKEDTPLPTVEYTILKALQSCKMVPTLNPNDYNFSRCGRTDKGVSAMNQVISLNVRSNLSKEDQKDPANDSKELNYIHILNQLLPPDIRMTAVCLRPPEGFDARFSCILRHYKYIFHSDGIDLDLMNQAAAKYEGSHDFRNFCKLDGSKQITNFIRDIVSSKILPLEGTNGFYVFDLKGSAFLWHQVRCMVAILFLVGQKLEKVDVIEQLLNVKENPRKPVYDMANDIPLLLYDCVFPDMEWKEPLVNASEKSRLVFKGALLDYQLKSTMALFMDSFVKSNPKNDRVRINIGDGKGRGYNPYLPVMERDVMESVEIRNFKWKDKKRKRDDMDESPRLL